MVGFKDWVVSLSAFYWIAKLSLIKQIKAILTKKSEFSSVDMTIGFVSTTLNHPNQKTFSTNFCEKKNAHGSSK